MLSSIKHSSEHPAAFRPCGRFSCLEEFIVMGEQCLSRQAILPASEPVPAPSAQPGFLERKLPVRFILGAFPLLAVPVAAVLMLTHRRDLLMVYVWLFSITHFVITFTIYLQQNNLRHFTASKRNIALFLVVPFLIFASFYAITVLRLRVSFPVFAVLLSAAIRLLDFNHFSRQAFGVYQLFKARTGLRWAAALKRTENAYFACLTLLLFTTFLAGGISPLLSPATRGFLGAAAVPSTPLLSSPGALRLVTLTLTAAAVILLSLSITGLVTACISDGRCNGLRPALAYLVFQTLSAVLGILSFPLYMATLAIHYVEYHVLMYPRCFYTELEPRARIDAWFGNLRRRPASLYLLLITLAAVVMMCVYFSLSVDFEGPSVPAARYLGIVAIFDGIFVFHYFIEMFIWKFSDPFFRRTLSALYFTRRPHSS
jgi:hypothetical protein